MEFTRDEILKVLLTMRVELPPDTKLPLDALEERLTRALEHSQTSLKNKEIDFSNLRRWKKTSKVPLKDVMGAFTEGEAAMVATTPTGQTSEQPPSLNLFMKLRILAAQIGEIWEGGSRMVLIHDESGTYCVKVHLVDVFEIKNGIPIIVFHYEHGLRTYFTNVIDAGGAEHERLETSFYTIMLLLRLLLMNAKRLSASVNPPATVRTDENRVKYTINSTFSILLPILPLTMREAGSLSNDAGCTVCGQPSVSRCAACQHAAYCSKDCQKADWTASHKSECKKRALASATWIDVDISSPGYTKDLRRRAPNDFSAVATTTGISLNKKGERIRPAEDWPPPNIYADKPFIVKIMGPEPEMGFTPLMVYDRRRSVEFYLSIAADSVSYEALLRTLRQSGHLGLRVFLFAKRTGPTTLSVCLDRKPPEELVKW